MVDLGKMTDEDLICLQRASVDAELERRGYVLGWHKPETCAGVIYILVNPAFPKYVKIGYADDVAKRLKTLNRSSGLPDPFHCYATYSVKKRLEDLRLHGLIDMLDPDLRHTAGREFFEMSKEDAYRILSAIAQINGDEDRLQLNPLGDAYFENGAAETAGTRAEGATGSERRGCRGSRSTRLASRLAPRSISQRRAASSSAPSTGRARSRWWTERAAPSAPRSRSSRTPSARETSAVPTRARSSFATKGSCCPIGALA